jgi:Domain of unknown function (DUF4386)
MTPTTGTVTTGTVTTGTVTTGTVTTGTVTTGTLEPAHTTTDDRSVLRWGGLAGLGGGLLLIAVFAMVAVISGPDPAGPDGPIARFPDIRALRTVENSLYLAALILWIPLTVALYRRLRHVRPAAALFGATLNVVGLGVLAAGALPHVATARLSDLYHQPGATAGDRATLALLWQATQGMFDALLLTGLPMVCVGFILLGLAMRRDPAVRATPAAVSVLLGTAGLAAAAVAVADPRSPLVAVSLFALIAVHLVVGWKTYRLSRPAGRGPAHD